MNFDFDELLQKTFVFSTSGGGDGFVYIPPANGQNCQIARIGSRNVNETWAVETVKNMFERGYWTPLQTISHEVDGSPVLDYDDAPQEDAGEENEPGATALH